MKKNESVFVFLLVLLSGIINGQNSEVSGGVTKTVTYYQYAWTLRPSNKFDFSITRHYDNGKITKQIDSDAPVDYEYSKNGKLLATYEYINSRKTLKESYKYDENGNLIENIYYTNWRNKPRSNTTRLYRYDEHGQLKYFSIEYREGGTRWTRINKNSSEETWQKKDLKTGIVYTEIVVIENEIEITKTYLGQKMIKEERLDANRNKIYIYSIESGSVSRGSMRYDKKGRLIWQQEKAKGIDFTDSYKYQEDANGNWTSMTVKNIDRIYDQVNYKVTKRSIYY